VLIAAVIASGATAGNYHDQSIKGVYASLTPDIYYLKNQIDNLNNQIKQLQNQNSNLQGQNSNLQAASVDGWFTLSGSPCYYGCYIDGAFTNYGTQDAKSIVVTLFLEEQRRFRSKQHNQPRKPCRQKWTTLSRGIV
jgi:hypothetical protein